jgi:hypothetical protein
LVIGSQAINRVTECRSSDLVSRFLFLEEFIMNLKNSLRAQAAIEYLLLASIAIIVLVKSANFVSHLKDDANMFTNHFTNIKSILVTGWK